MYTVVGRKQPLEFQGQFMASQVVYDSLQWATTVPTV